jgi:hypothetical protein
LVAHFCENVVDFSKIVLGFFEQSKWGNRIGTPKVIGFDKRQNGFDAFDVEVTLFCILCSLRFFFLKKERQKDKKRS